MSYYIARVNNNLEIGDMVIYRVVKRLRDFKAEDGQKYRVFKSKQEMNNSLFIPMYVGVGEKLKKLNDEFLLRW